MITIEELMMKLPDKSALLREGDTWEYWYYGKLICGSCSLRTLLEMEVLTLAEINAEVSRRN